MDFSTSLEEILDMYNSTQKTYTENGALAYQSSGKALLDFNFGITALRGADYPTIGEEFSKVFYENPKTAMLYWFYVMDIREGLGERNIARGIMQWLTEHHPELVEKVIECIPEYNRWDTLIMLADPYFNSDIKLQEKAIKIIEQQLVKDLKNVGNNSISLLAKWMPSENASSTETIRMANTLMTALHLKAKTYRKALSLLRAKLRIVERDMSANNWSDINYENVPSKANLNYADAFMRHDEERRLEYLKSVKKGESKINSKVLAPYEICHKYGGSYGYGVGAYDEALELMWKGLPQYQLNDILVVRDGSGSMTDRINGNISCLDVATSLAIYAAEHNSKVWKDKFITFSSKPQFVNMSHCSSLREKMMLCSRYDECSNTDIYKTMKLILNTAISNGYRQKDMPKSILIISDMQFDACEAPYWTRHDTLGHGSFNYDKTLFEIIQNEYKKAGYKLPKIVFWNVAATLNKTIPVQENELGMSLVSGFSANIFKMVLSEELDPYKQLLNILYSKRYEKISLSLSQN